MISYINVKKIKKEKIAMFGSYTFLRMAHTFSVQFWLILQPNSRSITCSNEDLQYLHVRLIKLTYICSILFLGVVIVNFEKYSQKKIKNGCMIFFGFQRIFFYMVNVGLKTLKIIATLLHYTYDFEKPLCASNVWKTSECRQMIDNYGLVRLYFSL